MLKVIDVAKVLGSHRVLQGVNLTVARGEVGVVLGANGSGKSTLLRVVCGVVTADGGDVEIGGISMRRDEARAKANLGYVPDATEALPELLVREFIDLVAALKRVDPPAFAPHRDADGAAHEKRGASHLDGDWIDRLGLAPFWSQSVGTLSFGQRKRVCLLAALCGDPPLLVLDEPSNGLDPGGVDLMVAIVSERQQSDRATLLSTNDAAFAARIGGSRYRLSHGTLVRAVGDGSAVE